MKEKPDNRIKEISARPEHLWETSLRQQQGILNHLSLRLGLLLLSPEETILFNNLNVWMF